MARFWAKNLLTVKTEFLISMFFFTSLGLIIYNVAYAPHFSVKCHPIHILILEIINTFLQLHIVNLVNTAGTYFVLSKNNTYVARKLSKLANEISTEAWRNRCKQATRKILQRHWYAVN